MKVLPAQHDLPELIVVCGPTATGKSDFAVQLAHTCNGEIISADSRQVYKGLDIGSGKITKEEMCGIPHHMLDVVSPSELFTVADFQKQALACIADIYTRGKTPILCGGTGFYIDAVLYQTPFPEVAPNTNLRKELFAQPIEALAALLKEKDLSRYNSIDIKNKVRVVRALEIITALGHVPLSPAEKTLKYAVKWHSLDFADDILKERIKKRLKTRFAAGMIDEVAHLHTPIQGGEGVSWERLESFGLEYRFIAHHLQGNCDFSTLCTDLEQAIWHYVKRQRTWAKKYQHIATRDMIR